jgi:hypothetical protein
MQENGNERQRFDGLFAQKGQVAGKGQAQGSLLATNLGQTAEAMWGLEQQTKKFVYCISHGIAHALTKGALGIKDCSSVTIGWRVKLNNSVFDASGADPKGNDDQI